MKLRSLVLRGGKPMAFRDLCRRLAASFVFVLGSAATTPGHAADGLTYLVHTPAAPSAHPPLIVLLHGSGADERDMIGLWRDLPATFVVVSPRAPFGDARNGFRWYRTASRNADIAASRKIIDLIVDNAAQRFDADPHRIFIGGFSQGAMMTYDVALRAGARFRGAAVLSGTLFPSARALLPDRTVLSTEAFFVAHGTADARIPYANATAARDILSRLGIPVAFHTYAGMAHTVGAEGSRDLAAWLSGRLVEAGGPR